MRHLLPPAPPLHLAPLHGLTATRQIERSALRQAPPQGLIELAGVTVAQLVRAIAPHARRVVVVCGPGLNGADGLIAARTLRQWGINDVLAVDLAPVSPAAARQWAQQEALAAEVALTRDWPPTGADVVIDALLGIGARDTLSADMAAGCEWLNRLACPVLCVDVPSGLDCDTGNPLFEALAPPGERHTLSLLTLKPGLFTGIGRDLAGHIWHQALGCEPLLASTPPTAHLWAPSDYVWASRPAAHHSHKGSHGDVMVVGGDTGQHSGQRMIGAAVLAARAALHAGAGRVYLGLVGTEGAAPLWMDPAEPGLMLRPANGATQMPPHAILVCGCGGGEALADVLPALLASEHPLVLDADALNLIARDTQAQDAMDQRAQQQRFTVITPHPLEAARLCGLSTTEVQAQRLAVASQLSQRWRCVTVLKGSGTVVSDSDGDITINGSGNGRLATAGTGDVLAGMVGAALARSGCSVTAVRQAVYAHGQMADQWPAHEALTATRLAASARPID
jgi:hydroxyethylthiazole kinase-like uncharacterized protein yjeF